MDCRNVFMAVGLIGVVVFSVPSAMVLVHLPSEERFSELYVLGPGHMAEGYPFDVRENESYLVYVGVGNHMGSSMYYVVHVKFRNQTDPLPNVMAGMPSALPSLYECGVFLQDGQSWEQPLTFSFSQVSFGQNLSTVGGMSMNGAALDVDRSEVWDAGNNGYFYELFMELWIYDVPSDAFQFHNRFVGLCLNMTTSS
jgi:hypothetical protein